MKKIYLQRPNNDEYREYFDRYIALVPEGEIIILMKDQLEEVINFLDEISEDKSTYRYADGKWSIKEVLGHMIDTELIMTYRALRIARKDNKPLEGFDENEFVNSANFDKLSFASLMELFESTRKMTIALFKTFDSSKGAAIGIADNYKISLRSIAYIIVGHVTHHLTVIKERYL